MADNLAVTPGTGAIVASDEATYSGDTAKVQIIRQVHVSGAEGSKVVTEIMQVEDAAAPADPTGLLSLARRRDTLVSEVSADGDVVALNATSKGELRTSDADVLAQLVALNSYPSTYAPSKLVSAAASTNATVAKASGGGVTFFSGYNANVSARYLKLYNKATAPTVGTDTPTHVFRLPPSSDFMFDFSNPLIFAIGISYALTTGSADNDTGALTAADVLCLMVGTI